MKKGGSYSSKEPSQQPRTRQPPLLTTPPKATSKVPPPLPPSSVQAPRKVEQRSGSVSSLHLTESTEAEQSAYPIVVASVCRVLRVRPDCLQYPSEGGMKKHIQTPLVDTSDIDPKEDISDRCMRTAIWKMYPIGQTQGSKVHAFWKFYETAKVAAGKSDSTELTFEKLKGFLQPKEIECDYFAYVAEAPKSVPHAVTWTASELLQERREKSPEGDLQVVMCEIKVSNAYAHAAAQLELRMAAYLAHRRAATRRSNLAETDVFACVALFLSSSCVVNANRMLQSPEFQEACPLVTALYKRDKCLVLSEKDRIFTEPSLVSLAHAPQPTTVTNTFWAQLMLPAEDPTQLSKAVAFRVTPVIADIDGLKKAVKAENDDITIPSRLLKVYAYDDATRAWVEVPEDAPLVANVKATAYHVIVP